MPELNIGIALSSLRLPFKKALHIAAQLGVRGVEIDARTDLRPKELTDTGLRQLRKMLDDLNLRVAAVRFQTRRGYDVVEDLDRRLEATKEVLQFAYRLGSRIVINAIGRVPENIVPENVDENPAYSQLRSSLNEIARHSQHIGASLACETGSEPPQRLMQLLNDLHEQAIGINFNPGNLIVNDYYDEESISQCASRVISVTARDGVQDVSRGRGLEVPLGRGSAEFPQILGVLEEQHYHGWYIIDRQQSADPITDLANAIRFLQAM